MIFIIAGIIIGVILEDYSKIFGGFCGFIVGLVVYGIFGSIIGGSLPTVENINTQNIVALNDSSKMEGQRYLFSGYINESLVYRYVIETENGKHVEECKADNGYIKEETINNPYVEIHTYTFKRGWCYWFAININCVKNYSTFYVPSGTVTNEYNVDLK